MWNEEWNKLKMEVKKGGTKNGRKESKMVGGKEKKAELYECLYLTQQPSSR